MRRTADVETLERLSRFKVNTTRSKAEVSVQRAFQNDGALQVHVDGTSRVVKTLGRLTVCLPPWQADDRVAVRTAALSKAISCQWRWTKHIRGEPVDSNAKHEPHCPLLFTGVTTLFIVQSTASRKGSPTTS